MPSVPIKRMLTLRVLLGALAGASLVACSLLTGLDGLTGPDAGDAGGTDAQGDMNVPDAGLPDASPVSCVDAAPQAWTPVAPGPLPGRDEAAIFWTGTDYLVFGGTEWSSASTAEVEPDGAAPPVPEGGLPLGCGLPYPSNTCSDGARYDPKTNTWTRISNVGSPPAYRWDMSWAFGGGQLFTYSGFGIQIGGWLYDLASDTWKQVTATNAPTPRANHASYYVNGRFFLWGGESLDTAADASVPNGNPLTSGAYYDPQKDAWYPTQPSTGFAGTAYYATATSDTDFFVWGGTTDPHPWNSVVSNVTNAGALYNYATNSWKLISKVNAPDARMFAAAVWTGSKFVVYGGVGANKSFQYGTGGIYDPKTDTWTATSMVGAPAPGLFPHTLVWTGKRMIVWGNIPSLDGGTVSASGAIFDPEANAWDGPVTLDGAPSFATNMYVGYHDVWNGKQMFVWGGEWNADAGAFAFPNSGALYTPPCAP